MPNETIHNHEHHKTVVDPSAILNGEQYKENPIVISKEFKFSFRAVDETIEETDEATGEKKLVVKKVKKTPVSLLLPLPTVEGLKLALSDPKQIDLILSLLADEVKNAAREQVDAKDDPVTHQSQLDVNKLTIKALSEVAPAERRGGGISKETWEEFVTDYNDIMPQVTGKSAEKIANASKIFAARVQPAKGNKAALKVLKEQLVLWGASTKKLEELSAVYEFLEVKIDGFLNMNDEALAGNL